MSSRVCLSTAGRAALAAALPPASVCPTRPEDLSLLYDMTQLPGYAASSMVSLGRHPAGPDQREHDRLIQQNNHLGYLGAQQQHHQQPLPQGHATPLAAQPPGYGHPMPQQSPMTSWHQQHQQAPAFASPCSGPAPGPSQSHGGHQGISPYGSSYSTPGYVPYHASQMHATPAFSHVGACGLFSPPSQLVQQTCALHAASHAPPPPPMYPPTYGSCPRQA